MEISWEYLGPYFDGEGCAGLYIWNYKGRRKKEIKVQPEISIACFNEEHVENIHKYLERQSINSTILRIHGKIKGLQIGAWNSINLFVDNILPFTIIKNKELTLLTEVIKLYYSLPKHGNGRFVSIKLNNFIIFAQKLHVLKSGKGQYRRKWSLNSLVVK